MGRECICAMERVCDLRIPFFKGFHRILPGREERRGGVGGGAFFIKILFRAEKHENSLEGM